MTYIAFTTDIFEVIILFFFYFCLNFYVNITFTLLYEILQVRDSTRNLEIDQTEFWILISIWCRLNNLKFSGSVQNEFQPTVTHTGIVVFYFRLL